MKLSDKDLEKMMKFVIEHKETIETVLSFLNEQDNKADTEHASDGINNTESMDGEGTEAIINEEEDEEVISEGDAEKAGTEDTSDGVDYPDVGDGTGVEGETLHEEEDCEVEEGCGKKHKKMKEEDTEELEEGEEELEEAGTASAPAPGGAAAPLAGGPGANTSNTGVARVKAPLGKKVDDKGSNVARRYDESKICETEEDVKAMMESWKNRNGWQNLYL